MALNLPDGSYRFRADFNGTQFWSADTNTCEIPTCTSASLTVTKPLSVTVQDTDGAGKSGIKVYAFDGTTYTNYSGTTDASGQVTLTLPQGNYRFRADLNGTQFWSDSANHCALPGCASASIVVTLPMTVRVQSQTGDAYPNLPVYAFDGTVYTGFHGTTDANGNVTFTLPQGSYRFRADYDGVQFWSAQTNECTLPGCTSATVTLPGGTAEVTTTIDYTYDPLYRLTSADYSTGDAYQYAYDSVGNRLTQESMVKGLSLTDTYTYDESNRLMEVDGISYTWDANGNLLADGANSYTYDSANRLVEVSGQSSVSSYQYNGFGDRLQQTVNGDVTYYTLDLNTGLTQVLHDGTHSYTYGLGRISQQQDATLEYFLGDALGSVRQMTDQAGAITFAASYDPYGVVTQTGGAGQSAYGYTGEQQDSAGMVYLRARYYNPADGRFQSRDTWGGDANRSFSYNKWMYAYSNPIKYIDSTGKSPRQRSMKQSGGYICPSIYNWYATGWFGTPDEVFSREQCARLVEIWNEPSEEGAAEMEAWYYKLSDRMAKDGYGQASKLLKHFLDGTGVDSPSATPFQLDSSFIENEIMKNGEVKNKLSDLKKWYLKNHADCATPSSGPDYFYTGIAQNGMTILLNGGIKLSLVAALNAFRLDAVIGGQNDPWKYFPGASWDINLHVVAIDEYDWTPGAVTPYGIGGPIVEDDWALLVARYGLASSFYVRGDHKEAYSTWSWISNSKSPLPSEWNNDNCIGEDMLGMCWQE